MLDVIYENRGIRVQGESSVFPCDLKLFSLTGQLILEKRLQSDTEKVLVNQKGVWIYQVQPKNGKVVKTDKIIIK